MEYQDLFLKMIFKPHKVKKDQNNILLMAVAGIGLYLFFKKKSATAPIVPPTTGGGIELLPIAPSPVYEAPVQPIYAPTEPVYIEPTQPIAPSPISTLPVFTDPILEIINLFPVEQYPNEPIYEPPVYTRPEPIYNFPVYETPEPVLKGSIEVGPIDIGQYGPAEDIPTDTEKPPMSLSMFDRLLFNPQQSTGGGGGGSASGGDFGGGGGGYGSGQNFLYDFIWYNTTPTLKGSIEVGELDRGEFL
jgi:uncharacterized membrane protein YgcG